MILIETKLISILKILEKPFIVKRESQKNYDFEKWGAVGNDMLPFTIT